MRKSVFLRALLTFVSILVLLQIGQSVVLLQFSKQDVIVREQRNLVDQVSLLGSLANQNTDALLAQDPNMLAMLRAVAHQFNAVYWVVNLNGDILYDDGKRTDTLTGLEAYGNFPKRQLTAKELETIRKGLLHQPLMVTSGTFNARFAHPVFTAGAQIYDADGQAIAVLLLHTGNDLLDGGSIALYRPVMLTGFMVLALGCILVFWASRSLTRPVLSMSRMARDIAQGNFNARAIVQGTDEIAQLAMEFNNMARELEKHEELQKGFVANVSHELRSPLTSMQGFAQGMLDGTIPPEESPIYLQIILDETKRLSKLTRELLDLSRMESGSLPLQCRRFNINELLRRVLVRYVDKIESKGVDVEIEFQNEDAFAYADSDRIEQVVVNLLDNAIKFTRQGQKIIVATREANGRILVAVSDTGDGIPDADLPYVFERFYKADKSHTDKKGTGLGLSIAKRIIEQHGEKIACDSKAGEGARFVFSLKCDPDQGEASSGAGTEPLPPINLKLKTKIWNRNR